MPLFGPPNVKKMKEEGDVNGLIKALSHENLEIMKDATVALGQIGDARAVEHLIANLKHTDVKSVTCEALKQIGEPAVQPLISALKGDDADMRRHVALALGRIHDPCYIEPLIAALTDKDLSVRSCVVSGLSVFGDPRAIEPLIATFNNTGEDEEVRASVVNALNEIRDPRVVEPLIAALKDTHSVVRWYSAKALQERRDLRTMDPMQALLNDTDEQVRKIAYGAVHNLAGPPDLIANNDNTVTDTNFGLIWQRTDDDTTRNYEDALSYCLSLKLAGHNDWRLPSKTELERLSWKKFDGLKQFFPGINAERYWAQATADQLRWAEAPDRIAYTVDFDPESGNYGKPITYFKNNSYFVRAVRNVS